MFKRSLEARFCCYLHNSRSLCQSLEEPGGQFLLLCVSFPPSLHIPGEAWKEAFVAIYIIPELFASPGESLEHSICRYLCNSYPLCKSLEKLGRQFLSLFVPFPLSLGVLGKLGIQFLSLFASFPPSWQVLEEAWKAGFVTIYTIPALFASLGRSLEGSFCCHLRDSRPLFKSWEKLGK